MSEHPYPESPQLTLTATLTLTPSPIATHHFTPPPSSFTTVFFSPLYVTPERSPTIPLTPPSNHSPIAPCLLNDVLSPESSTVSLSSPESTSSLESIHFTPAFEEIDGYAIECSILVRKQQMSRKRKIIEVEDEPLEPCALF
jgi:hypothetical protein